MSDSSGMPVSSALVESSVNHQNQQNTVTLQSSSPTGELVTAGESGKEANLEGLGKFYFNFFLKEKQETMKKTET